MSLRGRSELAPLAEVLELHLDDAAFLHEQRWRAPSLPGRRWDEAATLEERMERHLDALALSGRQVFELFGDRLTADGEPGQAFVMALVALRGADVGPKEALADALAGPAPEQHALIDALAWATAPDSDAWLVHLLEDARPAVRRAAVRAATLRPALLPGVTKLASDPDVLVSLEAQRTLAFLRPGDPATGLERHLDVAAPAASALALEVLLRRGVTAPAVAFCEALPGSAERSLQALALEVLAIAGREAAAPAAIASRMASDPELAVPGWIALGLCGERSALAAMLRRVDTDWRPEQWQELDAVFRAASLATGEVLEPSVDLDEAAPADLEALRARAHRAWDPVLARTEAGRRYRRGEEVTPPVLARDLAGPGHPRRDLCALELAARFRCPIAFEPRAGHAVQSRAARAIAEWAASAR